MAIAIEVYRGVGDRRGEDVHEPLLGGSLPAALERGRNELDARASLMQTTRLELAAARPDLRLGDLVQVADADQGPTWRGKIVGIAHSLAPGEAPTVLTVERPISG